MEHVGAGDELVVTHMQSLSRDVAKTLETVKTLKAKGGKLVVLEGSFDPMTSDDELGLALMAARTELEDALDEEANA